MFNKKKKLILHFIFIFFGIIFISNALVQRKHMLTLYESGIKKINEKEYQEAQDILSELGDYKDSFDKIKIAQVLGKQKEICDEAIKEFNAENYENSIDLFKQIEDFKNSKEYIEKYKNKVEFFDQIDGFKNSKEYIEKANNILTKKNKNEALYNNAYNHYKSENYILAIEKFNELRDYKNSKKLLGKCKIKLAKLQQATTISAGIRSSVGMIRHGKVFLAGDDEYSWKSKLDSWNDIVSVSVKGDFVIGLKEDGTVVMAGKVPEYYVGTKTWNNIISISAGEQYIIGLRTDGNLVAQGHNGDKQADIDDWHDIVAVSTGWRHTVGLNSNGKIYVTGLGSKTQLEYIKKHKGEWKNIVDIDAGGGSSWNIGTIPYTVALKQDGTVVTTLTGEVAEMVNKWKDIIAISAGDSHIVGLKSDGTVVTTQKGESEEKISNWEKIVAVSAGYGFTLGLKKDGKVVAVGYDRQGQTDVESWDGVTNYEEEWKSIFDEDLKWNVIK